MPILGRADTPGEVSTKFPFWSAQSPRVGAHGDFARRLRVAHVGPSGDSAQNLSAETPRVGRLVGSFVRWFVASVLNTYISRGSVSSS